MRFLVYLLPLLANVCQCGRLPHTIRPVRYEIQLAPFPPPNGNSTFSGEVIIFLEVLASTDTIVLHSRELNIQEKSIVVANDEREVPVERVTYDAGSEQMSVILNSTLLIGEEFEIHIRYWGTLRTEQIGFFVSQYIRKDGSVSYQMNTQMEPTGARTVLPCFDEPSYKANFTVWVSRPAWLKAVSNMPLDLTFRDEQRPGRDLDRFLATPKMSTYLLSVVVTDFSNNSNPNGTFAVHVPAELLSKTDFALDVGQRLLQVLKDYTGVAYPLPKLDNVAVADFGGAMENWGLITYEPDFLVEGRGGALERPTIAQVMAHEVAHQWFGDLVTPHWWGDLWLSEGFATLFEFYLVDRVNNSLRSLDDLVRGSVYNAFGADSTHSFNHPLSNPAITNNSEIEEMFDSISYDKGAAVLWMTMHALGNETFRTGLQTYLHEHQFSAATPEDLMSALQQAAGDEVNVTKFLHPWLHQVSFPLVNVTRMYDTQGTVLISQVSVHSGRPDQTWMVPLTWTTKEHPDFEDTKPKSWLQGAFSNVVLNAGVDQWVLFNIRTSGYYVVNYDTHNWALLQEALMGAVEDRERVHWLSRMSLLHDAFLLAELGLVPYSRALDLSRYLGRESNFGVWSVGIGALDDVARYLRGTDIHTDFKNYVKSLHTQQNSCEAGGRGRTQAAVTSCTRDPIGRNCPHPEMATIRLCSKLAAGALSGEHLPRTPRRRAAVLSSIPCHPDTEAVLRTVRKWLRGETAPPLSQRELAVLIESLLDADPHRGEIIDLLKSEWSTLIHRLGGQGAFNVIVKLMKEPLTAKQIQTVSSLGKGGAGRSGGRTLHRTHRVPSPRINVEDWQKRFYDEVKAWLRGYKPEGSFSTLSTAAQSPSGISVTLRQPTGVVPLIALSVWFSLSFLRIGR